MFDSLEMMSEAAKLLKGDYCVRAIVELKMDRAIIYCRTKLDCDNLERHLNSFGNHCIHVFNSMAAYLRERAHIHEF